MKYYTIFIILELFVQVLSKKQSCEPFSSQFQEFNEAMLSLLNDIKDYSNNNPPSPELASTHAIALRCEANGAIVFAAKAISRLSELDSSDIIDILNGTDYEDFIEPLDCITDDLINLREQIWYIRDDMANELEAKAEPLEAPAGICLGVLDRIGEYIPNAVTTVSTKAILIAKESETFSAIGMDDLYREYLKDVCIWEMIESALSNILGTDAAPAMKYIRGKSTDLPYPFVCLELFIDFLKMGFIEQLDKFFDGKSMGVDFPDMS